MALKDVVAALLGISTYDHPAKSVTGPTDAQIDKVRQQLGGQLSPLPQTKTRWYLADLESAMHLADYGDLSAAARLCRSMRRDGVLAGLLSTTSGGLVRLPKRFSGREDIVEALEGRGGVRAVFDEMFPASELELFVADGELLGVAVGEMRKVKRRKRPATRSAQASSIS
jgi:hypothetical protein